MRIRGTERNVEMTHREWLKSQIEAEPYWFHQIDLGDGLVTPGWSNAAVDKLPYFGLPEDMSGMRVLDIGCAEGFFSFEAERRGAAEVVAIDYFPSSLRRFNLCRNALNSKVTAHEASVYDLSPQRFGTFDLVMYFGVLYHLRHPLLSFQRIATVASGTLLLNTLGFESAKVGDDPVARFLVNGITSGPPDNPMHDPTVFWVPNGACIRDMLVHVGFVNVERLGTGPAPLGQGRASGQRSNQALAKRIRGRVRKQIPGRTSRQGTKAGEDKKTRQYGEGGPGVISAVFRADVPVRKAGMPPDDWEELGGLIYLEP